MSIALQISIIFLMLVFIFGYLRSFLFGIKRYQLNNSAYKKRKKGETFVEWLLYRRWKEEIPKGFILLYYSTLLIHLASILACLLFHISNLRISVGGSYIGEVIVKCITVGDALVWLIIQLLFWSRGRTTPYERWITKNRGQKKKKRYWKD